MSRLVEPPRVRPLIAAVAVVLAVIAAAPAAARAEVALQLDPAWQGPVFSATPSFGGEAPVAVGTDAGRIWTAGTAEPVGGASQAYVVAQRPDGTPDAGFSGDGLLTIDLGAGSTQDRAYDLVVLPGGSVAVLGVTDSDPAPLGIDDDPFILVLRPDGSPDPAFFGDGLAVLARPGENFPRSIAYDAVGSRLLVTGWTTTVHGQTSDLDAFVAAVGLDGAPQAGFGTGGWRVIDRSLAQRDDVADELAVLSDGRIATWLRWKLVGADGDPLTYASALRVLTATGGDDPSFSGDGDLETAQVTYPGGLAESAGQIVGVGARSLSPSTSDAMVLRVAADGSGLTQTSLDLLPGIAEGLDDLAVAPGGVLLAGGAGYERNGSAFVPRALAVRLAPGTLAPLERALYSPLFSNGGATVAPAPALPGGLGDALVLATRVNPQLVPDTQTLRAGPATVVPAPGADGTTVPVPGTGAEGGRPSVTGLRVTPARVRRSAARAPVAVFALSRPATVTVTLDRVRRGRRVGGRCAVPPPRRGPACVKLTRVASSLRTAGAGAVRMTVPGRLRSLAPGSYRVSVVATGADGSRSRSVAASLTVTRR